MAISLNLILKTPGEGVDLPVLYIWIQIRWIRVSPEHWISVEQLSRKPRFTVMNDNMSASGASVRLRNEGPAHRSTFNHSSNIDSQQNREQRGRKDQEFWQNVWFSSLTCTAGGQRSPSEKEE